MKLQHQVQWERLAVYIVAGTVLIHFVTAGPLAVIWILSYCFAVQMSVPGFVPQAILEVAIPYIRWNLMPGGPANISWISEAGNRAMLGLLFWCIMPASYMLLSSTLAKIRKRHIVRIATYSLIFATGQLYVASAWHQIASAIGWQIIIALSAGATLSPITITSIWDEAIFVALTSLGAIVFWGFAGARYLKIPHAWVVATFLSLASMLVTTLLAAIWMEVAN